MVATRKEDLKPLSKMNKTELLDACSSAGVNPPAEATNRELIALLEVAAEEAKSLNDAPKDDAPKDDAPKDDAPAVPAACGHFIAEGKSVTSKKGIQAAGDKVDVSYWDEATFKKLVNAGVIVHVK